MSGAFAAAAVSLLAIPDAVSLYRERESFISQNQNVVFPLDLRTTNGYPYIHMKFSKYKRRSIREQPFFDPQNSIRLPVPKELVDNVNVEYSTESLGPLIGAAVDAIAGQNLDLSRQSITDALQGGAGVIAGAGAAAASFLSSRAPGGREIVAGLSSLSGLSINPFQTVLFKSPSFKKHKFSWRLIPKSEQESKDIEFILRLFKYHMLPGISAAAGVFFSYHNFLELLKS